MNLYDAISTTDSATLPALLVYDSVLTLPTEIKFIWELVVDCYGSAIERVLGRTWQSTMTPAGHRNLE